MGSSEHKSTNYQQQFFSASHKQSCCNRLCCMGCFFPNQSYRRSINEDNENQDNSNWSKRFSRWRFDLPIYLDRIKGMAMKRYYVIPFCLILITFGCLIVPLMISRNIGDLDADSSTINDGAQSLKLRTGDNSHQDQLERRTVDLIDLIECGKTFAYTKHRIQVEVPKFSPIFNQKPGFLFKNGLDNLLASNSIGEKGTDALSPVAGNNDRLSEKLISEQYLEDDHQIDPLEQATSGLHLSSNSISNRTMLDCFLVDTDKRFDQKIAIEDYYRQVVSTRKIKFKKMMAVIIDCRKLAFANPPKTIKIKSIPNEQTLIAATAGLQSTNTERPPRSPTSSQLAATSTSDEIDLTPQVAGSAPPITSLSSINSIQSSNSFSEKSLDSIVSVTISPVKKPSYDYIGDLLSEWFHYYKDNNNNNNEPKTVKIDNQLQSTTGTGLNGQRFFLKHQDLLNQPSIALTSQESQIQQQQQQQLQTQKKQGSFLNMGMSMVNGIIPNTLWCGLGDSAANYSELGPEYKVDACCRAHDHCPIRLKSFSSDYGINNWSVSTRSHCECDTDFNDCLNTVNSTLSEIIKVLYFRFIGLQCIDVEGRTVPSITNDSREGEINLSIPDETSTIVSDFAASPAKI